MSLFPVHSQSFQKGPLNNGEKPFPAVIQGRVNFAEIRLQQTASPGYDRVLD